MTTEISALADQKQVAIVFPGQGAQVVGMGDWLCEHHSIARQLFDNAGEILGYDLRAICSSGPPEKLNETVISQPALFVVGIAAARVHANLFPEIDSKITVAAGLSLGEATAVCYAGGMSFEDGVRLVKARGEAMQACADAVRSGMSSALGLDLDKLTAVCDECRQAGEVLQPANLLCPGNIAVSGHSSALARLEPVAIAAGAMKVIPLSVAGAFHTSLMAGAVDRLKQALDEITLTDCRIPVTSNVDALPHTSATAIRENLARQVVGPVQWESSINAMIAAGIDGFLEAGTGRVLRGTIKRINRRIVTAGFGDAE